MRRAALTAAVQIAAACVTAQAAAQVVSDQPDAVAVTIYREGTAARPPRGGYVYFGDGGLALITETRTVDLPAGRQRVSFRGVADGLVPETAALEGLGGEAVERNYDFDLLTPGSLIQRSVNERVRLVRTNPTTGTVEERDAIIRSGPQGVLVQTADGVEALGCSGLTERLVFDRAPEGLTDRATLSVAIDVLKPGPQTLRLSYLATGFNWSADYVARMAPDGRTVDLTGWITLANSGGTTFENAPTQVVAGKVARDRATRAPGARVTGTFPACWPGGTTSDRVEISGLIGANRVEYEGPPQVVPGVASDEIVVTGSRISRMAFMSELGDYKLYTLPEPTTVAARQSKQVQFLDQRRVPAERVYLYDLAADLAGGDRYVEGRPTAVLRLKNEARAGLGRPLPGGTVSVMQTDAARPVLAGLDSLSDTPVGLPVELELGRAVDVRAAATLVSETHVVRKGVGRVRSEVEVVLVNGKSVPVRLELAHPAAPAEGLRVVSETRLHFVKDATPTWSVELKPGERLRFRYAVEARSPVRNGR
ncbi:hypothetical protein [Caulobacter sp. 17J65-9]|uniref:DUF4139 domain-containing protein n=1 Tax=Caulobacter sp. 17J65-9 TaxID=2709382 RepID=UPI0013CA1F3A|nr:hypothetical protein [Caulobacter sp. 17J65-9]NEX95139.1 hypothetical protein [Caulobacter sp. 17J65-9]